MKITILRGEQRVVDGKAIFTFKVIPHTQSHVKYLNPTKAECEDWPYTVQIWQHNSIILDCVKIGWIRYDINTHKEPNIFLGCIVSTSST